jgi:RimJ/RimL family protein N-acetyltransferase
MLRGTRPERGEVRMQRRVNSRIHLTEIRESDRSAFLQYLNDTDIHRFTCRIPYPYTDKEFGAWMDVVTRAAEQHGEPIHWAIRDMDDSLIGAIGFDNLVKGHRAELGYWLAKPYWGQGIMSSVVRCACQVAVSEWQLVRITAIVFENNLASVRVLEKNGFVHEALLKKYFKRSEQFSDALLYARIAR